MTRKRFENTQNFTSTGWGNVRDSFRAVSVGVIRIISARQAGHYKRLGVAAERKLYHRPFIRKKHVFFSLM
jgi:hypothetical protein